MGGQSRLDIELFQNNLNVTTGWFVLRFLYRQNGSYCKAGGSAKRFCVELSRPLLKLSRTMLLISRWKMKPGDLELLDLARKSQCVRRPRANTRAWRRRKKTFPKRSRKKNKKKPCKRRRTLGAGLNKRKWKKGASLDLLLTPWQCIAGNCFLLPLSQKGNKYRLNHFPIFCQATAFFRKQMPTSLGYAFVFVAETLLWAMRQHTADSYAFKNVLGKLWAPGSVTYWQRHVHTLQRLTVSMAIAKTNTQISQL